MSGGGGEVVGVVDEGEGTGVGGAVAARLSLPDDDGMGDDMRWMVGKSAMSSVVTAPNK